jgi:hypothetical protein
VVITKNAIEQHRVKSRVRDPSLPGYELGNELSRVLGIRRKNNDGEKGTRLRKENFRGDFK